MRQSIIAPPGITEQQAQNRLEARTFWLPMKLGDGAALASSSHPTVTATASATPHTKGSWVEIVAALTSECTLLDLGIAVGTSLNTANTSTLLDIGVGAGGSEVVVVPDLNVGYQLNNTFKARIPLTIPAGSRVAARCQGAAVSQAIGIRATFYAFPHGRRPSRTVVAMGPNAATSRGVDIAGTTANTKSSWVEITAATTEPFYALVVGLSGGGDTTLNTATALVDIGAGPAGSETVIVTDLPVSVGAAESITYDPGAHPVNIPKGTRLAARWARSNTGDSLDAALYGIRV